MKFFYLDDSYFRISPFLTEMRQRMFRLCREYHIDVIFISGNDVDALTYEKFIGLSYEFYIQVLMSPSVFEIGGIKGILTTTSLTIENFDRMKTFSGSLIYGDTETGKSERLYLELFQTIETDTLENTFDLELEEALKDILCKEIKDDKEYN